MDILIAEDDEVTVQALHRQLGNMGHSVVEVVDNYRDALVAPSSKKIDLALLDINLIGHETGVDIARVYQAELNLPCIFLTSTSNDFIINQVREIGVYGYLLKPISNKELFTAIEIAEARFKRDQISQQRSEELEQLVAFRTQELNKAKEQLEEEIQFALKLQKDLEGAQLRERKRIAANLHDGVCQKLTAAKFCLGAISKSLSIDGHMGELFSESSKLIQESLTEIREISHRLMPSEIQVRGLLVSLQQMFDQLNEFSVVEIFFQDTGGFPSLSTYKETILYRAIQESINNIIKHAKAKKVVVKYEVTERDLIFSITDDGVGFNLEDLAKGNGIGIRNLRDRCQSVGGHLSITTAPGKGTTVKLSAKI